MNRFNWRTLFYRLPRLTILTILIILAGALGALLTLGRQEDPTLIERFGFVLTTMPGADAERVEALVTDPIEQSLRELVEVEQVDSTSRANISQINIQIDEALSEAEVDDAWTLIRSQVEQARARLPAEASVPVVERQYIGAATMIVSLVWEEDREPELAIMSRMAQNLADDFRNHSGTEEVNILGLPTEEIRVVMDTDALAAAGLSTRQAAAFIANSDARTPAGQLRTGGSNLNLEVDGAFDSISRIRSAPLFQRNDGSSVRVGDVASVSKGLRDPPDVLNYTDGKRSVLVAAFIQPQQRVDLWAAGAREILSDFKANSPSSISVDLVFDQSVYTEARLNGLAKNLAFSALIVFGVLFFALGWRSALVVGLALPLTMGLVLILFNFFGIPLHQMSVTGLIISLGLLIDNAIVVVDEYDQLRMKGVERLEAIDHALDHLFAPLAASTLTTALAFVPIATLPGGAGEFVGIIGLAVIFSVVSSFFLAMTVIPAVAGRFDSVNRMLGKKRWWRDGVTIDAVSDGYRWTVGVVLAFPPIGILVGIVPAMIGFSLGGSLPSQFFPQTERDQMQIELVLSPETSIAETVRTTERATELLLSEDGVTGINWTIGERAPRVYYNAFNSAEGLTNFAAGWVQLDGPKRARQIVSRLQDQVRDEFPEAQFLVVPFEQGPPISAPIEMIISGPDLATLNELGNEARRILYQTPGVTYTTSSLQLGAPKVTFEADEVASVLAGSRLVDLAQDVSAELEGVIAGSVLEGVEELPVRVLASERRRAELSDLRSKTIGAGPGDLGTPISALGDVRLEPDTAVITRRDGERINNIQAFLEPYTLPAPSLGAYRNLLDESDFDMPPGYEVTFGGEAEASGDAMSSLLALAIPLILMITGAVALVFNSFRMSLLVLTSGFLSMGMAFASVWLFNLPMGFNAIIGSLGLLGIAINGSIVVLTQLRSDEASMADDVVAQREVVVDATRHIVATTLTTMGGFVPLILTRDPFWLPLASSIAGGVFGSALLALYFVPAVFRIMTMRPFAKMLGFLTGSGRRSPAPAE
ncbi:MAG: efflux RND transporter permease subunit [Pseudomonadota bacterium]